MTRNKMGVDPPMNMTTRSKTDKHDISIVPALPSDASALASLMMKAYGPDLIFSLLVPDPVFRYELLKRSFERRCTDREAGMVLKAVKNKGKGEIVGALGWSNRVVYANGTQTPEADHILKPQLRQEDGPPGIGNEELMRHISSHQGFTEMKWIILTRCDVLDLVIVDPAHQRNGIGTALVDVALQRANKERLALWLCSTPRGHDFFKTCGWNTVEDWPIDLSCFTEKLSGYGIYKQWFMLKLPSKDFGEVANWEDEPVAA